MIFGSKGIVEYYFNQMGDIPPKWIEEYLHECDKLVHPSFFYLHLHTIYTYAFLLLGCVLGVTADSVFMDGTIIDYNKTLEMEKGNSIIPFKGIFRWAIVALQFYILKAFSNYLIPGTLTNLWLSNIWMLVMAFLLFSITKYFFRTCNLTTLYLTFKDLEKLYNEAHWKRG